MMILIVGVGAGDATTLFCRRSANKGCSLYPDLHAGGCAVAAEITVLPSIVFSCPPPV
ncbi:hypothetical protein G7B40_009265 [Aetokthonos hydrillicola Thurmond2011]|jgi:hypothetical protein|uniref:Uncharacterized protein n=1 Tax=Aetokthonos hydrillicola Thurmond2011 TaxID=2712845 RepID=A0AAP5M4C8_9CYAN|nr:hypothetical protein [Aetokthonos hydrillicola]MBO3457562.1 hypothetical protein [Aetokthonos hydrillicola CCALA 1050]MBW4590896.1 hypothetical protein [Aetokthonos hydrillicola CCALA 1050]MDR9894756.1 hypothetical protein [Aetokthonos hydrillicola Thurmond2011]